jgi:hypothetical protein
MFGIPLQLSVGMAKMSKHVEISSVLQPSVAAVACRPAAAAA